MRVGIFVLVVPVVLGACVTLPFKEETVFEGHDTGVSNTVDFPIEETPLDPAAAEPETPKPEVTPPKRRPSAAPGQVLGVTVGSLGSPTETGLWIKTPLVQTLTQGRATVVATGKTVKLELRPIEGEITAGSRVSLEAMRALGLSLTALAELELKVEG